MLSKALNRSLKGSPYLKNRLFAAQAQEKKVKSWLELPGPPALPVVGSMPWLAMNADMQELNGIVGTLQEKYGDMLIYGFPMLQDAYGSKKLIAMLSNPRHIQEVLIQQGPYPVGGLEMFWSMHKYCDKYQFPRLKEFMKRGPAWKKHRAYVQKGLLGPKDSRSHFPGIMKSSAASSIMFKEYCDKNEIINFLYRTTYDLITAVLYGHFPNTTNPAIPSDEIDEKLVQETWGSAVGFARTFLEPQQLVLGMMGFETKVFLKFCDAMYGFHDKSKIKSRVLLDKYDNDQLTEFEKNCFLIETYRRWLELTEKGEETMNKEELMDLLVVPFQAGIETTANFVLFNLTNLALNQHVQDKLYEEICEFTDDGIIPESLIEQRSWLPYCHAVIRESHRLTPALPNTFKKAPKAIVVDGYEFPKDTIFNLQWYTVQNDPKVVGEDVKEFKPERWLKEAVAARKGTPQEVLDSKVLTGPFSFGARACPGQRVAMLETVAVMTTILSKYKVEIHPDGPQEFRTKLLGSVQSTSPTPRFLVTERQK